MVLVGDVWRTYGRPIGWICLKALVVWRWWIKCFDAPKTFTTEGSLWTFLGIGGKKNVGSRKVVKVQLQGIDGPIGGLGTFTACTLFLAYGLRHFGGIGCAAKSQ